MSNAGKKVSVHYVGTLDDGTQFDSSRDRGVPLSFTCMAGQMIKGFDAAVRDMTVGETRTIRLEPDEAYGQANPDMIQSVPITNFPQAISMQVGQDVMLQAANGQPFQAKVVEKKDGVITFDMNHPMAGKTLNFEIELLTVE
ncbi:MAG: peptidylprolyl isomerase [Atopobiaceae bacterium]|nr:peptidylprolyl isomerase [Atopobiaceae bacterium]